MFWTFNPTRLPPGGYSGPKALILSVFPITGFAIGWYFDQREKLKLQEMKNKTALLGDIDGRRKQQQERLAKQKIKDAEITE